MDTLHQKKQHLEECLRRLGSVAVAFSSGVDSTFLLKVAHNVLGDRAIAITARSCSFPRRELDEATRFCVDEGIEQVIVDSEELDIDGFRQNPKNRCYLCKRELFTKILAVAAAHGIDHVAEGSNMDDNGDYRPGLMAVAELGIESPLRQAELTKDEIRLLSREMGLPTWDKPSFACLASRFVYGETISEEKLSMVDRAEQRLLDMGFRQVRVRIHGNIARIEVLPEEFPRLIAAAAELDRDLRALGFLYVTLDLGGYRMGSMNRTLDLQAGADA
ncbi:MAG: ATP-dependent sacrificial sulfur transferase LarE [Ruminococcaceae bacterium]|jgi:uncharacterized protein|nr:ATP-dependent sacrificial sulfur transferase LarE [Oscillospiraceae bacterium]